MLRLHTVPQTVAELIKSSCIAWKSTFKHIRYFIGPLTLVKTIYPLLLLQLTATMNASVEQHGLMLGLLLITLIATMIMGCCFFAVFSATQNNSLSAGAVVTAVSQRSLVFLSTWLLCTLLTIVGSLCFIVPGVLFYLYTKYAKLIALFDNVTVTQAVTSSLRLVSGNWWRVLAVEAFIVLVNVITFLLAKAVISLLMTPIMLTITDGSMLHPMFDEIVTFLIILCMHIVAIPLLVNIQLLQLHDLKLRYGVQQRDDLEQDSVIC